MELNFPSVQLSPSQVQNLTRSDGSLLLPFVNPTGQKVGLLLTLSQVNSMKGADGGIRTRRTRMSIPSRQDPVTSDRNDPNSDPPGDPPDICDNELSCGSLINERRTVCGRWGRGNFTGWKNENQCKVNGEISDNACASGYVTICGLF